MAKLSYKGYVFAVVLAATAFSVGSRSLAFGNDDVLSPPDASYISVGFSPYIRSLFNSIFHEYTEEDVHTMLQVVTTRFNKMNTYIGAPSNESTNFSITTNTHAPIVTAKMNKKANSLVLQVSANYIELPHDINKDSRDYIMNVVSEANEIYPGTVSRVIIYLNGTISENNYGNQVDLTNFLQSLHTSLTRVNVKLGLRLWLQDCDASQVLSSPQVVTYKNEQFFFDPPKLPERFSLPPTTKKLLPHTDFVVFRPKNVYNFRNAEKTFQFLEKAFSKCEKAVRHELNDEVRAHLEFSWPSQGDETERPYYLVKFWKLLGTWAAERKQDVFIDEAFDSPVKQVILNKTSTAHLGWWRLTDLNNPNITTSAFVEKIFADDLSRGNEDVPLIPDFEFKDVPSSNNWHTHAFAGGSLFIVVFLVVARIMCRLGLTRAGSRRDDQHYLIT